MGTKIFMVMGAAAEVFLLYVLFHFAQEGRKNRHSQPGSKVVAIAQKRENLKPPYSKAA